MLALLVVASAYAKQDPVDVQVVWIQSFKMKFPTWTDQESAAYINEAIDAAVKKGLENEKLTYGSFFKFSTQMLNGEHDLSKPKSRTLEKMKELAKQHPARYLVVLQLDKVFQKNASESQQLANLAKPASETRVNVTGLIYHVQLEGMQAVTDRQPMIGNFKGPYFGTTNRDEIVGPPDVEIMTIRAENKKRVNAIANAVWDALKEPILTAMKAKT